MIDREKLIKLCMRLVSGSCKEDYCTQCELYDLKYPRCRGEYVADRIIESLEGEGK